MLLRLLKSSIMTPQFGDDENKELVHEEGEESDEYEVEDEGHEEEGGYEDEVEDEDDDEDEEDEPEQEESLTALLVGKGDPTSSGDLAEDDDDSGDYVDGTLPEQHIISAGAIGSKKRNLEDTDPETEGQQADDESSASNKKSKT